MIARLMGKRAGGRDQAVHRLLPIVKKEIKLEQKDSKALTIPRLDQKAADIAAGKRHPKAKGKGKGPKSARENAVDTGGACSEPVKEDTAIEKTKDERCAAQAEEINESKKRKRFESMSTTATKTDDNDKSEGIAMEGGDEGDAGSTSTKATKTDRDKENERPARQGDDEDAVA
jgi:hypothetical protein